MQMIQPELQKIQKKYKGKSDPESRQAMTQETMALYKKEGTNPFSLVPADPASSPRSSSALFRVLNGLDESPRVRTDADRPDHPDVAESVESATIFGAQLSDDLPRVRRDQRQDRHGRPHRPDVGDDLHYPAPADDEEHAGARLWTTRSRSSRSCSST